VTTEPRGPNTGDNPARKKPLRVLLVEDSAADIRLLREALKEATAEAPWELDVVSTLADAELAVKPGRYDCVLLDLGLPDANGNDGVERIRSANRRQTVIIMTGLDSDEAALESLKRGAQDYLVKGRYDGATLVRVIRHALERNLVLSEVDRALEQQFYRVTHDALTGLPNRQLFEDHARSSLSRAERENSRFAIGFIDLDGFKTVNDTCGHAIGDALLREVARVLENLVRGGDTVARVSGDEFLLLFSTMTDRSRAEVVVRRVQEHIAAIQKIEGRDIRISASIGLAFYPDDGRTLGELERRADQAMYEAKRASRSPAPHGEPSPTTIVSKAGG
jgi:diguanylate cyclase (GGDEF)-like protein